ncbi:MAG: single-stranded-DNA-specific exonuclease RecJ [Oenococcus sp.]|uniref:single-stranded-DNA-specific exonuclease RecJ n=1 Tax=Oenococcus sp. TaxID=1979414 RepID=UPI0039EAA20C
MLDNQYPWVKKTVDNEFENAVMTHFSFDQVTSRILASRFSTLSDIHDFLATDADDLIAPSRLAQIEQLKTRLDLAISRHEQIVIYGDYDADGMTSTAILYDLLKSLGAKTDYYVPNRFKDGYGPNPLVYQRLIDEGAQVIFAIDNGISGNQAVDLANSQGVDVLIADHHQIPDQLPNAKVIIHPDLSPDYPFKGLSAAGLAYKIASYLIGPEKAEKYLPLTTIGEIADVMPLLGENRAMIKKGIALLKSGSNPGLQSIMKKAALPIKHLSAQDIAFKIAPRLNSLGRMADASMGVELLTSQDPTMIAKLTKEVERCNQKRRTESDKVYEAAAKQVHMDRSDVIVAAGENWHEGVIGIVAGRLAQQFNRPALVFSIKDGVAKGSGRSCGDFDLYTLLEKGKSLYLSFGGHKQAAGLSLPAVDLPRLDHILNDTSFDFPKDKILLDADIDAKQVSLAAYQRLEKLAPFGQENPEPVFEFQHLHLQNIQILGADKKHFKLTVSDFQGEILFFNRPDLIGKLQIGEAIAIVGTLSVNEWRSHQTLQIIANDIRSEEAVPDRSVFARIYSYFSTRNVTYSPNDFYQKVFLELGFVKIVDGGVFVNPKARHAELSESDTYRKRAENGY